MWRSIRRGAGVAAVALPGLALTAAAPPALAQPAKPAGPGAAEQAREKELAKEWANKGRDRFERGDYAGAVEALREAERHFPAATILRLRAEAHDKLGQLIEAQKAYRQVAEEALPAGAAPAIVTAQQNAKAALAALAERIPTLDVILTAAAPGTVVKLDGTLLGAAELSRPIAVDPGKHEVVVEAPGREPLVRSVTVAEKAHERLLFESAKPLAGGDAAAPGAARDAAGRFWTIPGIAFGVGGAGLVLGAVTGALTVTKMDEIRKACGAALFCPDAYRGEVVGAKTMGHLSTIGFIVGGLGVATGVVVLAWPRKPAAAGPVGVQLGPGSVAVKGVW